MQRVAIAFCLLDVFKVLFTSCNLGFLFVFSFLLFFPSKTFKNKLNFSGTRSKVFLEERIMTP